METIKNLINENIFFVISYMLCTTVVIIIMAINISKRKKRYITWKKDTLNLLVFTREWERNDDKFIEELFNENEKLSLENKILNKEYTKLSIIALIVIILHILLLKIKKPINR